MGFNSGFKGLNDPVLSVLIFVVYKPTNIINKTRPLYTSVLQ